MLRVCEENRMRRKEIMQGGEQSHNKTHHNSRFLPNYDGVINSK